MRINKFGKGAIRDKEDSRDYQYLDIVGAGEVFDWNKGFDIEDKFALKVENQNGSLSCVSQAISKYCEVLELLENKTFTDLSARDIYSRIYQPQGGASVRDGMKLVVDRGVCEEAFIPSYENSRPPSENFMRQAVAGYEGEAKKYSAKSYATIYRPSIDLIAQVIRDNNGCVSAATGDNEGWRGTEIKPPKSREWSHAFFIGKAKMRNGKKMIGLLNSWGEAVGENGWQWFGEDYVDYLFNLWTLIDNNNKMTNVKLVKKGEEFGFYLPATNQEALKAMAMWFNVSIPLMPDGSVDWNKLKADYQLT